MCGAGVGGGKAGGPVWMRRVTRSTQRVRAKGPAGPVFPAAKPRGGAGWAPLSYAAGPEGSPPGMAVKAPSPGSLAAPCLS